ncbi:MAG TPA: nickel pincer cofactor biosynthesis protein LarC [Candidatus Acidoferrales bacterium]|nr:nickel pincer cofactor biosynthesis protein LarC [Candidatus Acidoferrales bacterium]
MKIAYFDCFSGISGDMTLGALVDAGCDLAEIERHLRKLPVPGWTISAEKVSRRGFQATQVKVETSDTQKHRGLTEILRLIEEAQLPPRIADRAASIFQRLGKAEALVHGSPIEKIHFHEVGAVDAIVDIVGAAAGFEQLGIQDFFCSPLNVGAGRVDTAHGNLPVPAPATAELLRGAPTYSNGIQRELVTPTGAAIVASVVSRYGAQPMMNVSTIGLGAGSAQLTEQPNVLRLFIGESVTQEEGVAKAVASLDEEIVMLEANLDDMNPQVYGYFVERALDAGALDVFTIPVHMKKNRPGQLLTVLCLPADREKLSELVFHETTTLGIRMSSVKRRTLDREIVSVDTIYGPIHLKVARLKGRILTATPEYEDCRTLAAELGIPLKQVLAEAMYQFQKANGVPEVLNEAQKEVQKEIRK